MNYKAKPKFSGKPGSKICGNCKPTTQVGKKRTTKVPDVAGAFSKANAKSSFKARKPKK